VEELLLTLLEEEDLLLALLDPGVVRGAEAKGKDREEGWG